MVPQRIVDLHRNDRRLRDTAKKNASQYAMQKDKNGDEDVQFYNWWPGEFKSVWFYHFVRNCHLLDNSSKKIRFCSVFGSREMLNLVPSDVKVFFSGENPRHPSWITYADSLLRDPTCNLSLGFDCFEDERYMRLPLWMLYVFEPDVSPVKIAEGCSKLRFPTIGERNGFAALISKTDDLGIRGQIYNALTPLGRIDCPSLVLHNDDSLLKKFHDDKIAYLRNYAFNICPENSNSYGYVTEKLFEAISAGCIPVYWGGYNTPEATVLNQDAIVFWGRENCGETAVRKISELWLNPALLREFMMQPRLMPTAEEEVERTLVGLRDRLKDLIDNL